MPRHPDLAPTVLSMKGSVYSALAHRLANYPGEVYPLHIGDTWMEPAVGARMQDLTVEEHPGMHRYSRVQGDAALIDAIVERVRARSGAATEPEDVLVTAGATGALAAVVGAMVSPGDEVLISAPFWPLIAGMVQCFGGTPVPVPLVGAAGGAQAAIEALEAACTERTVAVYVNTPNNPTGLLLPSSWLAAIVDFCRRRDLWVLSDEVYEDYVYEGEHAYTRPMAPERTFAAYSFSKGFGMAGNRCGYVVGPADTMEHVRKISTHTWYCTPKAAQLAALAALGERGEAWVSHARTAYAELGRAAAARLGVPAPQGSTFLFIDVADHLDERGLMGLLEDCVARGLFIAPGPSFGPYPTHIRVCFTSAPPDVVRRGFDVLAEILGR